MAVTFLPSLLFSWITKYFKCIKDGDIGLCVKLLYLCRNIWLHLCCPCFKAQVLSGHPSPRPCSQKPLFSPQIHSLPLSVSCIMHKNLVWASSRFVLGCPKSSFHFVEKFKWSFWPTQYIRFFPYIFFFYILFMYLFLTELGLPAAQAFSLQQAGLLFTVVCRLLTGVASLVSKHRLQGMDFR